MGLTIFNFFVRIYNNQKRLIAFIFISSVLFSLIFLIFLKNIGPVEHQIPGTDYFVRYEPMADNIIQGKGITIGGRVDPGYAPGFSIILAGIFVLSNLLGLARLDMIVLMNVILTAILACVLFFIAKEIFDKKIATIASAVWMAYPFNLWFLKNPNSEIPFLLILYSGIFLLILALKRRNDLKFVFLSGFALGASSLVRLPALFFSFFLALLIFFLFKKKSLKIKFLLAIILLSGNFLAILPWGVYSFSNNGGFIPVSNLASEGFSAGFTFLLGTDRGGISLSKETREALEELKERSQSENGNKALIEAFKNKPEIFLKLTWLRMARAWYATGMMWWENVIMAVQLFYLVLAAAGIIYAYNRYKEKIKYLILLLGIIIYFWAMSFLTIPILRYTIPAMPLVIIFLAVALDAFYGKFSFYNNSLQE